MSNGSKLLITSSGNKAAIIVSGENNSLTVYSQEPSNNTVYEMYGENTSYKGGWLITYSDESGAGIGGNNNCDGSNITINGGGIYASCPGDGACIGGGKSAGCDNIYIAGGTIEANGVYTCGIGCGSGGTIGNIYLAENMVAADIGNDSSVTGKSYSTPMDTEFFGYYSNITVNSSNDTATVFGESPIGLLIAAAVIILGGATAGIVIAKKQKNKKI